MIEEKVRTPKVENDDDTSVIDLTNQEKDQDDDTQTIDLRKARSTGHRRASATAPYCRKCEIDVSDAPSIVCPKCGSTPLCSDHFKDDQDVCALCTPSAFSETTTIGLDSEPAPIVEAEAPIQESASEHAVQSRAPVEFTHRKFDHRTVRLDDIIELTTAKKWAAETMAAVDVVAKYGGILVRTPFTRSTNDLDFLVQHLVLVGVTKRKATPMAEKIIADFERDVATWRSGGNAPRLMFDLSENVMNERFRSHPTTTNELYPLLLKVSAHILDSVAHDPPIFRLFMVDRENPYADGTYKLTIDAGVFKTRKIIFEHIKPQIPDDERGRLTSGILQLVEQSADSILGLISRGYAPAAPYRHKLRTHPFGQVRQIERQPPRYS